MVQQQQVVGALPAGTLLGEQALRLAGAQGCKGDALQRLLPVSTVASLSLCKSSGSVGAFEGCVKRGAARACLATARSEAGANGGPPFPCEECLQGRGCLPFYWLGLPWLLSLSQTAGP